MLSIAKSMTRPSSGLLSSSPAGTVAAGAALVKETGSGAAVAGPLSSEVRISGGTRGTVRATGPTSGPFSTLLARCSSLPTFPFSARHWSSSGLSPGPRSILRAASSGRGWPPSLLLGPVLECRGGGIKLVASFSTMGFVVSLGFFSGRAPALPMAASLGEFFREPALLWATRGTSVGSAPGVALSHGLNPWLGLSFAGLLVGSFLAGTPTGKPLSFCELLTFAPLERLPLDDEAPILAFPEEHL